MISKFKSLRWTMPLLTLLGLQMAAIAQQGQGPGNPPGPGQGPGPGGFRPPSISVPIQSDTSRTLGAYFSVAVTPKKAPDAKGFVQRWLVMDPIKKDITRNNIINENYLRAAIDTLNFSKDFTAIPKNNAVSKLRDQEYMWRAIDSKLFNFKLHRYSYAMNKPQYGVLYWVVTIIDCPQEIKNVRMMAGCNSAGMFWLNGEEALVIPGDKDMVVDLCASKLLTLKKGRNIVRGAIINGPGMIDFSMRFLDEQAKPVKNFTLSFE